MSHAWKYQWLTEVVIYNIVIYNSFSQSPVFYIEDIWLFQCEIDFLFHRMNTKSSIFTSGGGTSENITFSVHEWNKNWSYTEKVKFSFSFIL